jgi:toxin ParE1/3/4
MKIVYSPRARADFDQIAAYYSKVAGARVAEKIERRLRQVIDHIRQSPDAAPRVKRRSHVRVATVVNYPFRIFYQAREDQIDILYVRHTSRRP